MADPETLIRVLNVVLVTALIAAVFVLVDRQGGPPPSR